MVHLYLCIQDSMISQCLLSTRNANKIWSNYLVQGLNMWLIRIRHTVLMHKNYQLRLSITYMEILLILESVWMINWKHMTEIGKIHQRVFCHLLINHHLSNLLLNNMHEWTEGMLKLTTDSQILAISIFQLSVRMVKSLVSLWLCLMEQVDRQKDLEIFLDHSLQLTILWCYSLK